MSRPLSPLGAAALELAVEYGAAVFPLKPRDKVPATANGFHDASSHPEQVAAWWDANPDANIGLVPASVGAVVFDADTDAARAYLGELGAFDRPTATVTTRNGPHVYFACPPDLRVPNLRHQSGDVKLDFRGYSGYLVAPPSVHPHGHVYTWACPLDVLAPLPPRLEHALRTRFGRAARATVDNAPRPVTRGAFDALPAGDRLRRYVAKMPRGLEDGRKHACYVFAARLLHTFQRTHAECAELVHCWNAMNRPPLDAGKVDEIIANAARYGATGAAA
ncbi:MAG: bifunctional DNA primase/polymerase [Gemmatimonadetes bacterium]|nr:bifunctional DNA primase/polymerase [Gemmatimonadota bacterium]